MLGMRSRRPQSGSTARKGSTIEVPTWNARCSNRRTFGASAPALDRRVAGMLKLEVRRQAKLHPMVRRRQLEAGASSARRSPADRRRPERRDVERDRGRKVARSGIGQQTECSCRASVAEVGETHLSRRAVKRGATRESPSGEMARSDPPAFDEAGSGSRRARGCEGESASVNSERDSACPERKLRDDPTEGVLVRLVFVALTRRRAQRAWCGEVSGGRFRDGIREALQG
jgi:hypothetical protein